MSKEICEKHGNKISRNKKVKEKIIRELVCVSCEKETRAIYRIKNKKQILLKAKEYRDKNRDRINSSRKGKYKESTKTYAKLHKEKITAQKVKNKRNRKEKDPAFRIRDIISSSIRGALKNIGISKGNYSFLNKVDWSISDLKLHLESQFEPWMNWNNYGLYKIKEWDETDISTWKWNIDHIIPQSNLPYTSMSDDNFKKCWSLDNLRPYSAKQNIIDGALRARHCK